LGDKSANKAGTQAHLEANGPQRFADDALCGARLEQLLGRCSVDLVTASFARMQANNKHKECASRVAMSASKA